MASVIATRYLQKGRVLNYSTELKLGRSWAETGRRENDISEVAKFLNLI